MLANAIVALPMAVAAVQPPVLTPKIYNPFATNDPVALASRVGSSAFIPAYASLDSIWDGDVSNFPFFVVA